MIYNERPRIENAKKPEIQEDFEPSRVKSLEELRQQILSESEKEVEDFKNKGGIELAQAEDRSAKESVPIDDEDKKALADLDKEAEVAKTELMAEIDNEAKKSSQKEIKKIVRSGQAKVHAMYSAGQGNSPEYQALTSALMKNGGGKNVWKSSEEVDISSLEKMLDNFDNYDVFQKGKEKIKRLHADGKSKSSEYLNLYSHLTEGFGKSIKWRDVSEINVDLVKKMLGATESVAEKLPTKIKEKSEVEQDLKSTTEENVITGNVDVLATKERVIQTPELLSEKEASKKFLSEERKKLAEEIRDQRKSQRDRLSALKITTENAVVSLENMKNGQEDDQYGKIMELQSMEANELAKRISSSELSKQDAQDERENISQLISNGENVKSLKAKLEEHYARADTIAKKHFDTLNRSLEHVMRRNNAFIVHKLEERESLRHNSNSNVSNETTYEDDIDILLSLEPSVSASSVTPGEKANLWPGASGFLFGGGQIGEARTTDMGSHAEGIKKRGGKASSIEEIDQVIGRQDPSSRRTYEHFGHHGMNEVIVNNPEIFGFFQNAERDEDGRFWIYSAKEIRPLAEEMPNFFRSGPEYPNNRKQLKAFVNSYRKRFSIASERGIPLYIMTDDRKVYECLGINDNGTVEVGKQITPEEVATGRAGLLPEKRKNIGEKLLQKRIFNNAESMKEAHEIIGGL